MTAEQERAAIVKFLMAIKKGGEEALEGAMKDRNLEEITTLIVGIGLLPEMAEAIERGDHHKGE
jgi:hypothetical protein